MDISNITLLLPPISHAFHVVLDAPSALQEEFVLNVTQEQLTLELVANALLELMLISSVDLVKDV